MINVNRFKLRLEMHALRVCVIDVRNIKFGTVEDDRRGGGRVRFEDASKLAARNLSVIHRNESSVGRFVRPL